MNVNILLLQQESKSLASTRRRCHVHETIHTESEDMGEVDSVQET